jgi:glycosyltransferase involved in cell wall biosynthesis
MYPTADAPFYGTFVGDEVETLRRSGVEVDVYFVNGRRHKLAYAAMPFGFLARVLAGRYDIIHVHHSFCGLVAAMQRRIPVVWTLHEGVINAHGDRPDTRLIKSAAYSRGLKLWVSRRVDAVVAVSERVRQPLQRPDAVVIPSGVDMDRFVPMDRVEARRTIGLPVERRYVLFPSSPSRPEKRHGLARRAMDRLHEIAPETRDVDLVVLERVPHAQVPFYMNASEVVLLTSAFEASPVTIREALACNIPVVSTAVGDVPDLLEDIAGCEIVEPDEESIARALHRVLTASRRVVSRDRMVVYSRERLARELLGVYRRVLETRGRGSR